MSKIIIRGAILLTFQAQKVTLLSNDSSLEFDILSSHYILLVIICLQAEHYSALIDAWNDYYVNMTGKQLYDFYDISSTSPEFQQMPPCLALLLSVKTDFERIQNSKPFVSLIDTNDKNVTYTYVWNQYHYIIMHAFLSVFQVFTFVCRHTEDSLFSS